MRVLWFYIWLIFMKHKAISKTRPNMIDISKHGEIPWYFALSHLIINQQNVGFWGIPKYPRTKCNSKFAWLSSPGMLIIFWKRNAEFTAHPLSKACPIKAYKLRLMLCNVLSKHKDYKIKQTTSVQRRRST